MTGSSELKIKEGEWAVLRNGHFSGPIEIDNDPHTYPLYVLRGRGYVSGPWTQKGQYRAGDENPLDIIATLPCSPLERIRELEALAYAQTDKGPVLWSEIYQAEVDAHEFSRSSASPQGQRISELEARIAVLEEALRAISCESQTLDLLWWQVRARKALEARHD